MFSLYWWRRIIPFIFVLLFGALLWRSLSQDPHLLPSTMINKSVPEFSLPSILHPQKIYHANIFKGHISVLHVFASWCAVCQTEPSVLMRLSKQADVQWIGLAYRDQSDAVSRWLTQLGNPYHLVLFDGTGHFADNLGVYGTPETFLIDQNAVVRDKVIGRLSLSAWRKHLLPAITQLERQG